MLKWLFGGGGSRTLSPHQTQSFAEAIANCAGSVPWDEIVGQGPTSLTRLSGGEQASVLIELRVFGLVSCFHALHTEQLRLDRPSVERVMVAATGIFASRPALSAAEYVLFTQKTAGFPTHMLYDAAGCLAVVVQTRFDWYSSLFEGPLRNEPSRLFLSAAMKLWEWAGLDVKRNSDLVMFAIGPGMLAIRQAYTAETIRFGNTL